MKPAGMSISLCVVLGAFSSGEGKLSAQEVQNGDPVIVGRTYRIPSAVLHEERPVTVALPSDYDPARAYPVIYVLDGPLHLVHTVGAVQMLSRSHRMPESIVVAVANTTERNADMSPPVPGAPVSDPSGGRADELMGFFRDELRPWIDTRYPTRPLDVLIGHSQGGLFVAYVLNTEPELFDAYLSVSGSLQYDGGRFVASMGDMFERFPDARGSLYMTVANEGGPFLAANLHLTRTLEEHAPPSFRWRWTPMPEETHISIPARATYDGLEWIFQDWDPRGLWAELFDRGSEVLPLIESHFARLSMEVGFEVVMPVERVRMVARRLELAGRADKAIPIAEALLERDPDQFWSRLALGEALHSACRLEEARPHYREAIRLASTDGRPPSFIRGLEQVLDTLEEQIHRGSCEAGSRSSSLAEGLPLDPS